MIWVLALAAALGLGASRAAADGPVELVGHGGPIKGVAVDASGRLALTASFDYALGLWDATTGARRAWLDGHRAAVNVALFGPADAGALPAWAISAGDDFDLLLWRLDAGLRAGAEGVIAPVVRLSGHGGKVAGLAASADGATVASAGWDGRVGLWSAPFDGPARFLDGHKAAVAAVALSADGARLYSGSADGALLAWDVASGAILREEARHGFGITTLLLAEDLGWLAYGASDGVVRVIDLATGGEIAALTGDRRPILALALSPDRSRLAYGDGQGYVTVAATDDWRVLVDFRAALRGPIWALAFVDAERLLAAGLDDRAVIWPLDGASGPLFADAGPRRFQVAADAVSNGERQFARKCSVCHALGPDGGRRAGPPLYGLFGRPAGSWPGYAYSEALRAADIVWSAETVDLLFGLGPEHYTPGSKMPMQVIAGADDRRDLVEFLRAATAPRASGAADIETGDTPQ